MFFYCGMQCKKIACLQIGWVRWKWMSLSCPSCPLDLAVQGPGEWYRCRGLRYDHMNKGKEEYVRLFWESRGWGLTQCWSCSTVWTSTIGFCCHRRNCLVGIVCYVFPEVSSKFIWGEPLSGQLEESRNEGKKGHHTKGWVFGQFWWNSGLDTVPKWPVVCAVKQLGRLSMCRGPCSCLKGLHLLLLII